MSMLSSLSTPANTTPAIDITVQNFMQEVIQASLQRPVLVYFTAAWCGPCKQYGPLLEKTVSASKGGVKLARVDIDKSPQLAQQFRIQSVPLIYIFSQGQPVDAIPGVVPANQLKQMIAQLANLATEEDITTQALLDKAKHYYAQGKTKEAEQAFKEILAIEEDNCEAVAGLAQCFIQQNALAKAEQLLAHVPQDKQSHEALVAARATLTLATAAPQGSQEHALRAKIAANALDYSARMDLANHLFLRGQQEEAINELLFIIRKDRNWNEGAARVQLLTFFEALGRTHPLAIAGRRKLSSILFS